MELFRQWGAQYQSSKYDAANRQIGVFGNNTVCGIYEVQRKSVMQTDSQVDEWRAENWSELARLRSRWNTQWRRYGGCGLHNRRLPGGVW